MLHLFIQSSDEKHFPRQVSFVIDLLRNIQSNTGHTKASNMSWHPILGYCVSSPGTVRDQQKRFLNLLTEPDLSSDCFVDPGLQSPN